MRSRGATHRDLVKLAKLQCAVVVDGWPDALAVLTIFDEFQLPDTADVSQACLDLRHVQDLQGQLAEDRFLRDSTDILWYSL